MKNKNTNIRRAIKNKRKITLSVKHWHHNSRKRNFHFVFFTDFFFIIDFKNLPSSEIFRKKNFITIANCSDFFMKNIHRRNIAIFFSDNKNNRKGFIIPAIFYNARNITSNICECCLLIFWRVPVRRSNEKFQFHTFHMIILFGKRWHN